MLSSWIVGKALTDYRVKKLVLPHVVVDILRIIPPVVVVAFIHTAPAIPQAMGTDVSPCLLLRGRVCVYVPPRIVPANAHVEMNWLITVSAVIRGICQHGCRNLGALLRRDMAT